MKALKRILLTSVVSIMLISTTVLADKTDEPTTETITESETISGTGIVQPDVLDKKTTEETSTETTTEATTVAPVFDQSTAKWEQTDKGRRYVDANGIAATGITLTIDGKKYEFDENGYVKEDPSKHGENYNSTSEIFLIQGNAPIERVENAINALNDKSEEKSIRDVRYMYNALTMAQKARVKNEEHLYSIEKVRGITYDYATIYANDQSSYVISGSSVKGTSYSYELNDNVPYLSITLQYTTDTNMDGIKEVPVISMKKPDGTTISIPANTAEIRDSSMNVKMTWYEKFMQFDIASGEFGKWMIMTDEPVVFTSMEFAGSMQEIVAIPEDEKKETTESPEATEETSEKKSSGIGSIIKIVVCVGGIIVFFVLFNKSGKEKEKKPKKYDEEEPEEVYQTEEDIEKIRAELKKQFEYEDYSDPVPVTQKREVQQAPVTQDEAEDSGILYGDSESDFLNDFL